MPSSTSSGVESRTHSPSSSSFSTKQRHAFSASINNAVLSKTMRARTVSQRLQDDDDIDRSSSGIGSSATSYPYYPFSPSKLCSHVSTFNLEGNIPLEQQFSRPYTLREKDHARLESKPALFGDDQTQVSHTSHDGRDYSDDYTEEEAMVVMLEREAAEQLHKLDRPWSRWWRAWNRPTINSQGQGEMAGQQGTRTLPNDYHRSQDGNNKDLTGDTTIKTAGISGPSTTSRFMTVALLALSLCAIVWVASPLAGTSAATFKSVSIDSDFLLEKPVLVYRHLQSLLPRWRTRQVQDSSLQERWPKPHRMHEGTHHTDHGDADFLQKLRVDLSLIDQRVLGVEQQLKAFIEEVGSRRSDGQHSEWVEVTVVELVRDEIPPYLAVVKEPGTGVIRIPVKFWYGVQKLLAAGTQDGRTTINNEKGSQQTARSHRTEAEGTSHTWDGFLEENAMALQNLVDERIAVYTRGQFLDLVRSETRMVWAGMENQMLDRLARYHRGSEGSSSESAAKARNEILWELTSGAVEQHPADALEKPDFALYNAGGRVIPELTFTDYFQHKHDIGSKGWSKRLLARLLNSRAPVTRLAEKAIQPSMHAGDCWAMNGSLGQIGIRLIRSVVVTAVTIEHVDPRVALDKGSAPREIEVWSLITPLEGCDGYGSSGRQEYKEFHQSPIKGTWWKEGSPCPGASQLTVFEYKSSTQYGSHKHQLDQGDKEAHRHVPGLRQTFSIPLSRQKAASRGLVLKINSNWGHPEFTCLYRVRVHGYPQ